ncbi:MAG: Na(+)/H(+) antiporter subunit D [Actinophytocola sp.]|nr:Na(+)/H(+) antiporter subunit D [Actinophytocola sp.]
MSDVLLNPGLVLIVGAAGLPLLRGRAQQLYLLALPLLALALLVRLSFGERGRLSLFGLELVTIRLDALSFVFALAFLIAAVLAVIYSWHLRDATQHVSAVIYAGAATAALLAGDLITLFVFWELTAVASAVLIWARRSQASYRAGLRYLLIQALSGVLLLGGAVLQHSVEGHIRFELMALDNPAGWFVLLAFGIKGAFPFLHNWLQDSYPEATPTGTVWLSVYTTKLAVYALARGFAGTELLVWVGVAMTLFPVFYAVIENDLRRVLSYSLNNQIGFMIAGVGVGTELAINGAAAHAFAHIIYKALLFMAMGAVLHRVGTIKASELGGLHKSMPWTARFCIVGSASISAVPLLSGFVTKSMILAAVAEDGRWVAFALLLIASAGVVDHSGIKIPFFSFFAHDSGLRCREAPAGMLLAMGLAAALCIGIGLYPQPLYDLLPYAVEYVPYTASHVITQAQLVLFAAAAFSFLYRRGLYPPEIRSVNLDADVVYRRALPYGWHTASRAVERLRLTAGPPLRRRAASTWVATTGPLRPNGRLGTAWSTHLMVWCIVLLLGALILLTVR